MGERPPSTSRVTPAKPGIQRGAVAGYPFPLGGKVRACPGAGRGWGSVPPPPSSFLRRQEPRGAGSRDIPSPSGGRLEPAPAQTGDGGASPLHPTSSFLRRQESSGAGSRDIPSPSGGRLEPAPAQAGDGGASPPPHCVTPAKAGIQRGRVAGYPFPLGGKVRACPGAGRGWGSVPPAHPSRRHSRAIPPSSFLRSQESRGAPCVPTPDMNLTTVMERDSNPSLLVYIPAEICRLKDYASGILYCCPFSAMRSGLLGCRNDSHRKWSTSAFQRSGCGDSRQRGDSLPR